MTRWQAKTLYQPGYELIHKTTWELYRQAKLNTSNLFFLNALHPAYIKLAKRRRWIKYERQNRLGWKIYRLTERGASVIFREHGKDLRQNKRMVK